MSEKINLRFAAPETVIGFNDLCKLSIHRIGLAKLSKIRQSNQRHRNVVVDQLLTARNLVQIDDGIDNGIKAAYVGDHGGGVQSAVAHHFDGLDHVVGITARVAADVGEAVVNVVEVEHSREGRVGRTGEEVQTAIKAENAVGKLDDGLDGSVNEGIVVEWNETDKVFEARMA